MANENATALRCSITPSPKLAGNGLISSCSCCTSTVTARAPRNLDVSRTLGSALPVKSVRKRKRTLAAASIERPQQGRQSSVDVFVVTEVVAVVVVVFVVVAVAVVVGGGGGGVAVVVVVIVVAAVAIVVVVFVAVGVL